MSDTKTRIGHVPREEWTDAHREIFAFWGEPNAWEEGSKTNVMMMMANHPAMASANNIWSKHLLMGNTLNTRQLEIIILRVAINAKSEYEWHNHVGYGLNAGLSLDEIAAIRDYPAAWDWAEEDEMFIKATDELMANHNISDATWAILSKYLDTKQLMDTIFTVGHYVMTSWGLAAMGVPIEGGADQIGFDLKTKSGATPKKSFKPGETEDWLETRDY